MSRQNNTHQKENEKIINLVEIFMYLAFRWKWFVLSVLLFAGYSLYSFYKAPLVYSRSAKVIIKDTEKSQSLARMTRSSYYTNPSNVSSEILQFKSKELMRKAIDRLHADVSYTVKDKLRFKELYQESPVAVSLLDVHADSVVTLTVVPKNEKHVRVFGVLMGMQFDKRVNIGDTLHTPVGRLVVEALKNYVPSAFDKEIKVTKHSREDTMEYFLANLKVTQPDEEAPVLRIMISDYSSKRAEDMVNMLVALFNEDAVED